MASNSIELFKMIDLFLWLKHTKKMDYTLFLVLVSLEAVYKVKNRAVKQDVIDLHIFSSRWFTDKKVNDLARLGYVSIGDQLNPWCSASIELTISGKMLLKGARRILNKGK